MDGRNALPLYGVDSRCGGIEHYIDEAVIKQVDLIHIQDATIGLCLMIPDGATNSVSGHKPKLDSFFIKAWVRALLTSKPGSYALMPSERAFSMSMVPQIRSSVAPRGSSTCQARQGKQTTKFSYTTRGSHNTQLLQALLTKGVLTSATGSFSP